VKHLKVAKRLVVLEMEAEFGEVARVKSSGAREKVKVLDAAEGEGGEGAPE
jgi:hypothetical protein